MEVNSQKMDQMLVNTAAQAPANQSARTSRDEDRPDFDSMVHQKRTAGKAEGKTQKADAKAQPADEKPQDAPEQEPVTGEQLAAAAAMLLQTQPDARIVTLQPEPAEAEAVPAVETVPEAAETAAVPVEIPAVQQQEAPIVAPAAEAAFEAAEPVEAQNAAETPAEAPRQDRPVEAAAAEEKPEAPAPARAERRSAGTENVSADEKPQAADTEERAPEAARPVRSAEQRTDERSDEGAADAGQEAQAAQTAPLFERVEAPVVKVAEAPRPVALEAENGVEQLANELDGAIVNSADADRIVVTLTPEHLGKLTVELSRGTDGTLSLVLHTTTQRAASLLEKSVGNLQNLLSANTRGDTTVEVRPAGETERQFLDPNGQNEQGRQQQQQNRQERRREQASAQDFLQQLRLGLVDVDGESR